MQSIVRRRIAFVDAATGEGWIASARLAMTGIELAQPTAVIPRESGGSSTPRLIHFIAGVSGLLGRPLEPVIGLATAETRWRTTTVEVVTSSAP